MTEVYKTVSVKYDIQIAPTLFTNVSTITKGNKYKLLNHRFHYDLVSSFLQLVLLTFGTGCLM